MNNSERFYFETDIAIKLVYCFLNEDSRNHEYQAKKAIKMLNECGIDINSFRFSLVSLIDITSFALNKEKIENQANIDWNNYKAEITSKLKNFDNRFSYIPYFKEWVQVKDCAEKYKTNNAQFWIKKIRDAFLHGKFELDYSQTNPYSEIKIKQGSATKTDVDIKLYEPGLTEFIEDNFRNIYNQGYGIKDSYSYLQYPDFEITDFKSLEEYIAKIAHIQYKIDFDKFKYDGMTLNSADGDKLKPYITPKQISEKPGMLPEVPKYLKREEKITCLRPEKANLLARLIEKKAGYIYNSGKKREIVHKYYSNYIFTFQTLNSLLQELVNVANYIDFAIYSKEVKKSTYNKTFGIIDSCKDNLKPAFTMLQLYRLLYRLQNDNLKPVDLTRFDCEKLFYTTTPELVEKKIEKVMTNTPELTKKEATNKIYLEILRDALAHGNVSFETQFSDDLSQISKVFTFTDCWTDRKTGEYTETKIISNVGLLEYLFTEIDKDLDFLPYKDMEDEI